MTISHNSLFTVSRLSHHFGATAFIIVAAVAFALVSDLARAAEDGHDAIGATPAGQPAQAVSAVTETALSAGPADVATAAALEDWLGKPYRGYIPGK